ncbi:hypothetical protein T492DRAFT_909537, partial [Pavlovales sp. CCMP2436]
MQLLDELHMEAWAAGVHLARTGQVGRPPADSAGAAEPEGGEGSGSGGEAGVGAASSPLTADAAAQLVAQAMLSRLAQMLVEIVAAAALREQPAIAAAAVTSAQVFFLLLLLRILIVINSINILILIL